MPVRYAEVIGDPIGHSKSPAIHRFWLAEAGLDGDYRACRAEAAGLGAYLAARRLDPDWLGCNVTIPHKQTILPLLDESGEHGIGAVNCVVRDGDRLIGLNTDVDGVAAAIGRQIEGPCTIIGAGGGAAAAIAGLARLGASDIRLIARDSVRARALLDRFAIRSEVFGFDRAEDAIRGAAALVNASPLGMQGFPAMPQSLLRALPGAARDGIVLDMVYAPLRTALLAQAEALGLGAVDGLVMLVEQAATAFARFFGVPAPRARDAALRELLAR